MAAETWEGRTSALDLFSREKKERKKEKVYSVSESEIISITFGYGAQMTRRIVASGGAYVERGYRRDHDSFHVGQG